MKDDPFILDEPAVVSFSGGRTSGYMSHRILTAGGPKPRFIFCNTGKERLETLDFVHECDRRWKMDVIWLEYVWEGPACEQTFRIANYESASRKGEPFDMVIANRAAGGVGCSYPPNRVTRYCTSELKVKTMCRWAKSIGLEEYTKVVGLRHDEPGRVQRLLGHAGEYRSSEYRSSENIVCPLHDAKVELWEITEFWKKQCFDLKLQPHESNCDLCFLKKKKSIVEIMMRRPDLAGWWTDKEKNGAFFRARKDRAPYAQLLATAQQPRLFPLEVLEEDEDDISCMCTD